MTTDLGAGNGSLDGASNIALDTGDFFVVTTPGGAFYSETLEVGDLIFANQGQLLPSNVEVNIASPANVSGNVNTINAKISFTKQNVP